MSGFFVGSQRPENTEEDPSNTDKFYMSRKWLKKENRVRNWLLVLIPTIMAIFTIRLFYIATYQAENTTKAANAAELAAKTARDQLDYQKRRDSENAVIQNRKDSLFGTSQKERDSLNKISIFVINRAFLVIDEFEITGSNSELTSFDFNIAVQNIGKTSAYEVNVSSIYVSFGKIFSPKEIGKINMGYMSNAIIGEGNRMFIRSTNDKITGIRNEDSPVFFFGKITYRDLFGKMHYTQFCYGGNGIILGGQIYSPMGKLNKTDKD
jgi:hypothetical protein